MLALIVDDKTKHQFLKLSHTLQILRHIQRLTAPSPLHTHTSHICMYTHTHTLRPYMYNNGHISATV